MISKRKIQFGLIVMIIGATSTNTFWINPRINYSLSQYELLSELSLPEEAAPYLEDAKTKQRTQQSLDQLLMVLGIIVFNTLLLQGPKKDQNHD